MYDTHALQNQLSLSFSIIKTKGRAMEVVTHFVNDTVEFYKWSLTIAGESSLLLDQVTLVPLSEGVHVYLFYSCHHIFHTNEINFFFLLQTRGWRIGQ